MIAFYSVSLNLASAANVSFPPGLTKARPLCACDFGSGLTSPGETPGVALADVLNQVRAERDEAAPVVSACRRVDQPIAA